MDIETEFVQRYRDWRESLTDKERRQEAHNLRLLDAFRNDFRSVDRIQSMTLDEYAIHKGHKDTFCYRVETQLWDFGEIRGRMCSYYLYGIALDRNGRPLFHRRGASKNRFGEEPNEIFAGVLAEIAHLYEASQNEDYDAVEASPLSGFFANKLSYLFNPDRWMPIYGTEDLLALCTAFGLGVNSTRTGMRKALFDFMQSLHIDDITPYLFMRFCYSDMGYREVMRPKCVSLDVQVNDPVSFLRFQRIETAETLAEKKRTGTLGEQKVLEYLKTHRVALGIVGDIDAPCLRNDDSCHYDLKYATAAGDCYVEVKATKCRLSSPVFFMSAQEYDFMCQNLACYKLFFVNDVYGAYSIQELSPNEIRQHLFSTKYCCRM